MPTTLPTFPLDQFPKTLGAFRFSSMLQQKNASGVYHFALYKDVKGRKAFAKLYVGSKNSTQYLALQNEISSYKLLSEVHKQHNSALKNAFPHIEIAEFISSSENDGSLLLLTGYLHAPEFSKLSPAKQVIAYENVMKYFAEVSRWLTPTQISQIKKRGALQIAFSFPVTLVKFASRGMWHAMFKAILEYPVAILSLASTQSGLVHRDLDTNVLLHNDMFVPIDFQLTVWASPIYDAASLAVAFWKHPSLFSAFMNSTMIKKLRKDDRSWSIFKLLVRYTTAFSFDDATLNTKQAQSLLRSIEAL